MPITSVNTPSGQVLRINHPEGATEDQIIAFAARQFETSTDDDGLLVDIGKGLLTGGLQAAINAGAGFEQARGMLMPEDEDTSDEAIDAYIAQQPPELGLTREEVLQHRIKKNQAKNKALDNAVRLRDLASSIGERIGLDEDFAQSLPGQIVQGFGQVPVSLAAGAVGGAVGGVPGAVAGVVASAAPQMISEAINDAEGTLKKSFTQMDSEERNQVAMSSMGYVVLGTALESAGFLKTVPGLKNFLRGGGKLTSGQLKSLKREVAEGFAAEGFTESAQGQLLDSFANATYDDDRELMSMNVLGQRFNEFLIGGVVGGGTAGGFGAFERASRGTLFQPRETKAVSTGGQKIFEVTYTDNSGNQRTRPVQASSEQEAERTALEIITDANLDEQFIISEPGAEVTAEAMGTYIPQRFVGERAEAAPPFFKKFQPEQYDEGRFVDLETTEDLSDQTFEGGSIRIEGGSPVLETSDTSTDSIMERKPSEEGALVRSNLFKQKAGWKWTQAPEGEPSTIVSVEQGSKHYYTLDFTSGKPLTLKTYPDKKSEPRGRPTTRGEVKLGNKVGEIEVRGKKHPVYDRVTVGEPDVVAGVGSVEFIRGATGDPKQNLRAKKNRQKGTGEGKNESIRLEVDGLPLHIGNDRSVGGKSFAGWAEETSAWFTDDEIFTAGSWYEGLEDRFIQEFGPDRGPKMMLAWLASQQNASPSAGIQNTFRVIDRLVGIKHGKKGGLADAKLESIFRDQVPEKGLGAKLSDFIDAGNGRTTRTIMGDNLEGGRPFVADVHTGRDSGKLDQQTLTRLKEFSDAGRLTVDGQPATVVITKTKKKQDKIVPEEAVLRYNETKVTEKGPQVVTQEITLLRDLEGSPSNNEYEAIAEWGNDLTDYLNKISWKGKSDWLPAQIQAVGWMRTLRQYGLKESDLETSFIENTYRVSAEVDYGLGGAITSIYPKFDELNEDQKTQVTEEVLNDIVPAVIELMAPSITLRDSQFGVGSWEGNLAPSGQFYLMGSEEAVRVFTNALAWVTEQAGTASVVMGKGGKNNRALTLRNLDEADIGDFVEFIESKRNDPNKKIANAAKAIQGFSSRPSLDGTGIIIFGVTNRNGEPAALTEAKVNALKPLLEEFALTRNDLIVDDDSAIATFTENDWRDKKNGESYLQEIQSGGVTTEIRDRLVRLREQYGQKLAEVGQRVAPEVFGEIPVETRVDRFVDAAKEYLEESEVTVGSDVSAEAITAQRPSAPEGGFASVRQLEEFIRDNFKAVASKVGVDIVPNYTISTDARYNVTKGYIEYNPRSMFTNRTQDGTRAAMREEIIHAAMHKVLMQRSPSKSRNNAWLDFMGKLGKDLTQEQRDAIAGVYTNLQEDHQFGAEYSRAAIQYLLYGNVTEQYVVGGKSWETIKSLLKSVQRFLARTLGKDIETNPEAAAVVRDSVDLVLRSDPEARITNQKISSEARRIADRAEGKGAIDTDIIVNAANPPSKKKKIGFYDKFINTASTVLSDISPRIERLFQQYLNKVDSTIQQRLKSISPFIKKFNGIRNEEDKRRLKQLLYYSPSVKGSQDAVELSRERDLLLQKYGMFNEYNLVVRPILDDIRQQANEQGMDVDYLEDYFPRRVLDLAKLEQVLGKTVAVDFRSYIQRINEDRAKETDITKRKPIIEEGSTEEALEFDKYIRSGMYTKRGIMTKHTKARTYEFIEDSAIDFYADPGQAIEVYISNMTTATETMRLLGRRYETDNGQLISPNQDRPGELGLLIQELLQNGEIDSEQAYGTLPDLAKVILNPIMKENSLLASMRTFSYFTLLVEPTTTISQIFDLPFQMYQNGFFRTIGSLLGGKEFRLEDVGISKDDIGAEFRNEKKFMADALRIGLKATGFSRMDQLMKETTLSANYKRIRSLSRGYLKNRNSKNSVKLKTELDFILGDDADAAIAAFAKGDRNNPFVREVLLRKLLEFQPVNRLEMPLAVSDNPNLRMLYTMKSFMIKQLAFVKNNMLNDIAQGIGTGNAAQALRGSTELAKLMFFMLMVGMPADALKDFLAGRSGYFSDYMFNGVARLFGISRYQTFVARKEGIGQAAFDFITPVGIQQFVDNTAAVQRVLSGQRAITDSKLVTLAPMSDVLNRLFGFGRAGEQREFQRRLREGELPTFIPPGAL